MDVNTGKGTPARHIEDTHCHAVRTSNDYIGVKQGLKQGPLYGWRRSILGMSLLPMMGMWPHGWVQDVYYSVDHA